MPSTTMSINAEPAFIWALLTSTEDMPRWMGSVKSMATTDGQPIATGSSLIFQARGKTRHSTVVECDTQHRLTLRSTQGNFSATYTYTMQGKAPVNVSLKIDCQATGLMTILKPLISRLAWATDKSQLQRLKNMAEKTDTGAQ